MNALYSIPKLLVSTTQLTVILIITAAVFMFFIVVAVIKMRKLKAENKKLIEMESLKNDVEESYKDFTNGHLYE
ncbi:hypothetical protein EVU94_06525 [Flavobacteriaceae bacterium 144Ye]|uniref:hypothetical protein n=1 Tax=Gaetbulibacter TaxID=311207 RepID=UPI00101D0998|nr:hypothetical protein [Gaetbulibacter sp. NE]RYH74668.1 hypothetical protein EVU94_06525 [Flavobacteriaceae bacterium 144Ye]